MRSHAGLVVLIGLLGATLAGFAVLLRLRLNHGDSFPVYSSLRSDPLGLRALHDSLDRLPAMAVTRSYVPLRNLAPLPARTIILAGMAHGQLSRFEPQAADAIDAAARAGCRIVISLRDVHELAEIEFEEEKKGEDTPAARTDDDEKKPIDLGARWDVHAKVRLLLREAVPEESAPEGFESIEGWTSDAFFDVAADAPWTVFYRRGREAVLIERPLGRGSVVLAGSGFFLTNEALQRERVPPLLAWAVGPHTRVEFNEGHLGVIQNRGVAALARSYGLTAAFFAFAVAAGLFVWRRMALFVPPASESREVALVYNPTAGLEALLRRAVPAADLPATCVKEARRWLRPVEVERAEAALAVAKSRGETPVATYNAIARAMRRR